MVDTTKIIVPDLSKKLGVLIEYAKSKQASNYPKSQARIAELLRLQGHPVSNGQLTKVKGAERAWMQAVHKDLLLLFEISWPCPYYYDIDPGGKRDRNAEQLRAFLFPQDHSIRLVALRANDPAFPDNDLFVFRLVDESSSRTYAGRISAKPAKNHLVVEEGEWKDTSIGYYSFSEFTVRIETIDKVAFTTTRPLTFDQQCKGKIEAFDRSSDQDHAWLIRACDGLLDGVYDVAQLEVTDMAPDQKLFITATAPLPSLTLAIPPKVVLASSLSERDLEIKFRKIAQNKVRTRYAKGVGEGDGSVIIGKVAYSLPTTTK